MRFLLLLTLAASFAVAAFSQEPVIRAVNKPAPVFPAEAKEYIYGDDIKVLIKVDKTGKVNDASTYGPLMPCSNRKDPAIKSIRAAAIEAAKATVLEPVLKDGKPSETELIAGWARACLTSFPGELTEPEIAARDAVVEINQPIRGRRSH